MGSGTRHEPNLFAPESTRDGLVGQRGTVGGAARERPAGARHEYFRRPTVSLTAADVAEIMRMVEQSTFDELTLELDGIKLCLRRGAAAPLPSSASAPVLSSRSATVARTEPAAPVQSLDPNVRDVTSPLLGTFYRAPKPGAPPFVEIGATVEEDTIVAIVEVMKLMNAV